MTFASFLWKLIRFCFWFIVAAVCLGDSKDEDIHWLAIFAALGACEAAWSVLDEKE